MTAEARDKILEAVADGVLDSLRARKDELELRLSDLLTAANHARRKVAAANTDNREQILAAVRVSVFDSFGLEMSPHLRLEIATATMQTVAERLTQLDTTNA